MAKPLLQERFQQLAGIKPLYETGKLNIITEQTASATCYACVTSSGTPYLSSGPMTMGPFNYPNPDTCYYANPAGGGSIIGNLDQNVGNAMHNGVCQSTPPPPTSSYTGIPCYTCPNGNQAGSAIQAQIQTSYTPTMGDVVIGPQSSLCINGLPDMNSNYSNYVQSWACGVDCTVGSSGWSNSQTMTCPSGSGTGTQNPQDCISSSMGWNEPANQIIQNAPASMNWKYNTIQVFAQFNCNKAQNRKNHFDQQVNSGNWQGNNLARKTAKRDALASILSTCCSNLEENRFVKTIRESIKRLKSLKENDCGCSNKQRKR